MNTTFTWPEKTNGEEAQDFRIMFLLSIFSGLEVTTIRRSTPLTFCAWFPLMFALYSILGLIVVKPEDRFEEDLLWYGDNFMVASAAPDSLTYFVDIVVIVDIL